MIKPENDQIILSSSSRDVVIETAQLALNTVSQVTNIAGYTLVAIGVFIAIVALFGVTILVIKSKKAAEEIAKKSFNDYIKTEEFKNIITTRLDKSIEDRWQTTLVVRMSEDARVPGDASPFPSGEVK